MKVYIITRFSIFDPSYNGFKIKHKNGDNYKEKLNIINVKKSISF